LTISTIIGGELGGSTRLLETYLLKDFDKLNNNRVEPVQPEFGKIVFLDYVNNDGEGREASAEAFVPEPFAFGGI